MERGSGNDDPEAAAASADARSEGDPMIVGKRARDARGFTLVEVMFTVLLIGIVAAIGIPTFRAQVARSNDADAQEYVRQLSRALESCFVDTQTYLTCSGTTILRKYAGQAGTSTASTLRPDGELAGTGKVGLFDSGGTLAAYVENVTATTYRAWARSKSGNWFIITRSTASPTPVRTCSTTDGGTTQGDCAGTSWGS
ncbi:MAG: prepilin-type N-terminal cleavage/methylation domain-containing protein [Patulibacter sp.]